MGFSVRVSPGVRVRASSRGVRASIGPRAARFHVGAGGAGFSTGVGPVTYSTSLGSPGRRNGHGTAVANRELAALGNDGPEQSYVDPVEVLRKIIYLPETEFVPASRPIAPAPPAVHPNRILEQHVARAKASTSVFRRAAREEAIQEARKQAEVEIAETTARQEADRTAQQAALDAAWEALCRNNPDAVLATLAAAFEDNEAAAAAVGVAGAEVTVVVILPPASAVPERGPSTTAAGNFTLKKLNKSEAAAFYMLLVCGHVLVTIKETLAVAPSISAVRIVAVRQSDRDAYGNVTPEVMLAGVFERERLRNVVWEGMDAARIVNDTNTQLVIEQKGATKALAPIDLGTEPELQAVVSAIDFEDILQANSEVPTQARHSG